MITYHKKSNSHLFVKTEKLDSGNPTKSINFSRPKMHWAFAVSETSCACTADFCFCYFQGFEVGSSIHLAVRPSKVQSIHVRKILCATLLSRLQLPRCLHGALTFHGFTLSRPAKLSQSRKCRCQPTFQSSCPAATNRTTSGDSETRNVIRLFIITTSAATQVSFTSS